jgi:hypothetical protein
MKPRENEQQEQLSQSAAASPQIAGKATANTQTTAGKRKQNNAGTTAAGRKIARKTAHSLIERRRRSKMNEEFGVLKDMIPACKGQEMHKLAILQVSIEHRCMINAHRTNITSGEHRVPSISRAVRV